MSLNGRAKTNHPGEWCALESIVRYGIIDLESHALAIYLEFVPTRGAAPERFEECQCENDDFCLHCRTWVLGDGHYRWLQRPINPFPMEHQAEYLTRTIRRILEFLQL